MFVQVSLQDPCQPCKRVAGEGGIMCWKIFRRILEVVPQIDPSVKLYNHGEGPYYRAFSWLKAPTSAFTFKTLLRHYAKRALTLRSLNVKLGPRHKSQKGRAGWLA